MALAGFFVAARPLRAKSALHHEALAALLPLATTAGKESSVSSIACNWAGAPATRLPVAARGGRFDAPSARASLSASGRAHQMGNKLGGNVFPEATGCFTA